MSREGFNPGLRLKIRVPAGAAPDPRARPSGLEPALTRALGKAGAPYDGLALTVRAAAPKWDQPLPDVLAALPEGGLICLLEGGQDHRALCVLDRATVDALIEVQTTGRVDKGPGLARAPTRIDAALTRDFVGLFLAAFAGELAGVAGIDWPLSLTYGTHLADPRGLDLLLPDQPCHLFAATLDMGQGAKTGQVLLAVPVVGGEMSAPVPDSAAPGWGPPWHQIVLAAPSRLEAVLLRQPMPLSRIEGLQVGDTLPFDKAALADLSICDAKGRPLFKARLGRSGGHRAVRLSTGAGLRPAPASRPEVAPPPSNAAPPDRVPQGPVAPPA